MIKFTTTEQGFESFDEALFSKKKVFFSEKGGGNSVSGGLGKDFYRKGNSVKRSGDVLRHVSRIFRIIFRFGISAFSGQFRSAEAPP